MTRPLTLLLGAALTGALLLPGSAAASDPDSYIVVLEQNASDSGAVASEHSRKHGAGVKHVYGHALRGYAATIPSGRVAAVRADSRVAYVERDGTMSATQTLPWGISQVGANLSSTKAGDRSGSVAGVTSYVIDSGIASHRDLNVVGHVNFAGGKNTDCNGHGTHVAGTVAARDDTVDVVGVAPGAPQVGVKVLGCSGSGSTSGVIAGVDWVTANAANKPAAVANMSLGGGVSQALDDAVVRSASSGVTYSIAAGNDGVDACNESPARAGAGTNNGIITTAATDSAEREASWSNYGKCVDIWAPGVSILSTKRTGGVTTMSGTSMAAPHVAGGGALYLSRDSAASPSTVEAALKSAAVTTGKTSKDTRPITRLYVGGF